MIQLKVVQTNCFMRAVKKLHANQKANLDKAVKVIMDEPDIGQPKTGDLSGVLVYKFNMVKQLTLVAYIYEDQTTTLTLLALGAQHKF